MKMKEMFKLHLKEIRQQKNITQAELADILGITQSALSQFENGKVVPTVERLIEFAVILNVTLDELIEYKYLHNQYSNDLLNKTK
jgi:transcriptional regulator with XRE-family HTH domain